MGACIKISPNLLSVNCEIARCRDMSFIAAKMLCADDNDVRASILGAMNNNDI